MNDKKLDEMLTTYGSRKAPYTFKVKWEEKTMTNKRNFRPAVAVVCVACLLMCAVFSGVLFADDLFGSDETLPKFLLSVSAAEEDFVIGEDITIINKDQPLVSVSRASMEFHPDGENISEGRPVTEGQDVIIKNVTCVSIDTLSFKISGEEVEFFDITAEKGLLDYCDFEVYKNTGEKSEALNSDRTFEELKPFDENDPYRYVVGWYPDLEKFNADLREVTGGVDRTTKNPDMNQIEGLSKGYNALLKDVDDLNKYFGDTIKVILHYKDGTTEQVNIKITLGENGCACVQYENINENVDVY